MPGENSIEYALSPPNVSSYSPKRSADKEANTLSEGEIWSLEFEFIEDGG